MTTDALKDCLAKLEAKYKALGRFWAGPLADTFAQQITDWDEQDGPRAVRRFVYEEQGCDPATLTAVYLDICAKRRQSHGDLGEKPAPGVVLRGLRAGYTARYRDMHDGADPRDDDPNIKMFKLWQARLDRGETIDGRTRQEMYGGPVPGRPNVTLDPAPDVRGGMRHALTDEDPFAETEEAAA